MMQFKKGQYVAVQEGDEWHIGVILFASDGDVVVDSYDKVYSQWKLEEWQASSHGILAMLQNMNERLDALEAMQKDVTALYRKFIGDGW